MDVYLPRTWALLDGSLSADDVKVASFKWRQLSGPSPVTFNPANASCTNATGLTKGHYTFQLTVTDSDGNMAVDSVSVAVYQSRYCFLFYRKFWLFHYFAYLRLSPRGAGRGYCTQSQRF